MNEILRLSPPFTPFLVLSNTRLGWAAMPMPSFVVVSLVVSRLSHCPKFPRLRHALSPASQVSSHQSEPRSSLHLDPLDLDQISLFASAPPGDNKTYDSRVLEAGRYLVRLCDLVGAPALSNAQKSTPSVVREMGLQIEPLDGRWGSE
jgi:hypothetical protein